MLMPEAAMYEDYFSLSRKYEVRNAGQVRPVKPVAEAHTVDETAHQHFGFRALAADCAHIGATISFTYPVQPRITPMAWQPWRAHPDGFKNHRVFRLLPARPGG